MATRSIRLIRAGRISLILFSISGPLALWLLAGMSIAEDKLSQLIAELRTGDLPRTVSAAATLEKMGPRAATAVQALAETLRDKNAESRVAAARALHAIGPEANAAVAALVKLLDDRCFWVRDQAAEALAAIGEPATPLVVDALKTGPPAARAGAALALGRIGMNNKAALPALIASLQDPEVRVRATAVDQLAQFGGAAAPALARAVADDDATVVVAAAEALQTIHSQPDVAVPALALALSKPESRAPVARALQEYGTDAQIAVPALIRGYPAGYANRINGAMYDKDAVIESLKQIGPARTEDAGALCALLQNESRLVRALTAEELGKLPGTAETVDALRRALRDSAALVRVQAARAIWLVNHDSTEILGPLASGFDDGDYDTTRAASETLALIGEPAVPTLRRLLNHKLSNTRWWVAEALQHIEADTAEQVPDLIEALQDSDPRICNDAAAAMARIGARAAPAIPHLIQALNEKRLEFAAFTLAVQGIGPAAKTAKEPLIQALDGGDEQQRLHALSALCRIGSGDESIAAVTIAAVRNGKVRSDSGLHELGQLGAAAGAAVPFAMKNLQNANESVRQSAAELIGNVGPAAREVLPSLRTALDDAVFSVRFEAAVAIWRITGAAEQMVTTLTRGFLESTADGEYNTYFERRQALYRVDELGPGAVVLSPALARALELESAELAIHAAETLGKFGPAAADAVPALTRLSQRTDWPRRKAALDALKKIGATADKKGQ